MADETPQKKTGGALGWRLALSAIIVPVLVALFYFDARAGSAAPVLYFLCVLLALRATWEAVSLLTTRLLQPNWPLTAACSVAVIVAGWLPNLLDLSGTRFGEVGSLGLIAVAYAMTVLIVFFAGAVRYREAGSSMETLGAELITVSYVGLLLAITSQLRWTAGADAGYLLLGSLVVSAKCGDIFAYTFGRLFGKRKMAPALSPGKTWMGALGALVGSGFGGWAWLYWGTPLFGSDWTPCHSAVAIAYGVCIGVVGLIGDLCESLIKRDVGKKDAAELMPGFGGLLDLLDSVLYAGPVAYLLWQLLPLQTWP